MFTRPDGRRIEDNGSRRFRGNISPSPALRLAAMNREEGIAITPRTSRCRWLGERMDYSTAIESMQFRERREPHPAPV